MMEYKEVKKIVNNIADNEVNYVKDLLEKKFIDKNLEYKKVSAETKLLYEKLIGNMTREQAQILDQLFSSLVCESVILNEFYFKKGLKAGITNLKFLNEIDHVGTML